MTVLLIALGILAVYLFMVFPAVRKHEYRKAFKGQLIAHRGLFSPEDAVPENSMEAFALAVANGYGIETDIRLTADGELVIYHDKDLSRLTACDKDVEELTLAEIRELSLDGTEHKIPTFKEFLRFVDGKVPLVIEFKSEKLKCPMLCEKADEILREYSGIYSVQSFDPYVVYWYKKHRPEIFRGQLADVYKDTFIRWLLSTFLYNFLTRPDYIAFSCEKGDSLSYRIQKMLGAFTAGWTFKEKNQLADNEKVFDAYIFEGFLPKKK